MAVVLFQAAVPLGLVRFLLGPTTQLALRAALAAALAVIPLPPVPVPLLVAVLIKAARAVVPAAAVILRPLFPTQAPQAAALVARRPAAVEQGERRRLLQLQAAV